jgi:hypothetical protein
MKTLNWIACIAFGIIAITALIIGFVSTKLELFAIAFICGSVSYVAYIDIKHPQL